MVKAGRPWCHSLRGEVVLGWCVRCPDEFQPQPILPILAPCVPAAPATNYLGLLVVPPSRLWGLLGGSGLWCWPLLSADPGAERRPVLGQADSSKASTPAETPGLGLHSYRPSLFQPL